MSLRNNRYRPTFESLEQRNLLTTASLYGGYLYVLGTSGNDYIGVSQSNGRFSVYGAQIQVGSSSVSSVDVNSVKNIVVYSYGGKDIINLHMTDATKVTAKGAFIYAGNGGDQIYGGDGGDYIYGGAGNDTIYGGAGNDTITSDGGTDYLYGGAGNDVLIANGGLGDRTQLVGATGTNWYDRPITPGSPVATTELATDVVQGQSPLCQTQASLAAAVNEGHNFANDIQYLGNSNYRVTLRGGPVETVNFNGYYTDTDAQIAAGSSNFWQVLMQRARLEALGIDPTGSYTTTQWNALNASSGNRLYSVNDAMAMFTGSTATTYTMNQADPTSFANALARGYLVVASSTTATSVTADGIIGNHAYAVMSVYYQDNTWKVRLYNPWGVDGLNGQTIDSLSGAAAANDGYITLTWAQFVSSANFRAYTASHVS